MFTLINKIRPLTVPLIERNEQINTKAMYTQPNLFLQQLQKQFPDYFISKKVMEAGGPTGCGLRRYFSNCSYAVQHGVQAAPVHRLDMPNTFDVIIHAGTLHYDRHWINTLCAMYRNLKPGGALIITCAGPSSTLYEDDEPPAYYQPLSTDELTALLPVNAFSTYRAGYAATTYDLEFFGVKK